MFKPCRSGLLAYLARSRSDHKPSWHGIRNMGGGPRTFPGGVTKWQWKRMQEKKREDIQRSKLKREKQIYEMRKRGEVLEAHPELVQPWEKLATFPSDGVTVDEQISSLVSRFQRPNAQELWTEQDGPEQLTTKDDVRSAARVSEQAANSSLRRCQPTRSSSAASSKSVGVRKQPMKGREQSSGASPRAKNVQDYFDSFESDPLGIDDAKNSG